MCRSKSAMIPAKNPLTHLPGQADELIELVAQQKIQNGERDNMEGKNSDSTTEDVFSYAVERCKYKKVWRN